MSMPSNSTVERFVGMVEAGQGLDALVQFYSPDATMQENFAPPRVGKEALLKYEQAAQASVRNLKATCVRPILLSGDTAVIRWVFEYESSSGKAVRFEELAYQRWEDELIVTEQFFYDPGQLK
jgi:ketosteroid isomerase-like protein